jgi:hypothetical protein
MRVKIYQYCTVGRPRPKTKQEFGEQRNEGKGKSHENIFTAFTKR